MKKILYAALLLLFSNCKKEEILVSSENTRNIEQSQKEVSNLLLDSIYVFGDAPGTSDNYKKIIHFNYNANKTISSLQESFDNYDNILDYADFTYNANNQLTSYTRNGVEIHDSLLYNVNGKLIKLGYYDPGQIVNTWFYNQLTYTNNQLTGFVTPLWGGYYDIYSYSKYQLINLNGNVTTSIQRYFVTSGENYNGTLKGTLERKYTYHNNVLNPFKLLNFPFNNTEVFYNLVFGELSPAPLPIFFPNNKNLLKSFKYNVSPETVNVEVLEKYGNYPTIIKLYQSNLLNKPVFVFFKYKEI